MRSAIIFWCSVILLGITKWHYIQLKIHLSQFSRLVHTTYVYHPQQLMSDFLNDTTTVDYKWGRVMELSFWCDNQGIRNLFWEMGTEWFCIWGSFDSGIMNVCKNTFKKSFKNTRFFKKNCITIYFDSRQFGSADPDTKWWCRQQQRTWWWQKFGWNHSVAKVLPLRFFNRIPTWSNKSSWKRETFLHRYISVILLYFQVLTTI